MYLIVYSCSAVRCGDSLQQALWDCQRD